MAWSAVFHGFDARIVANDPGFVNLIRRGLLVGLLSCLIPFGHGIFAPADCQCNAQESDTSELFRQAVEKLGEESQVRWIESGDASLGRWDSRRVTELSGVIVEWDPKKLTLIRRTGTGPTTYPGDQVIGIDVGWKLDAFAEVHQLFLQKKFSDVLREGQAALKETGAPRWQQRLLVAEMVQSASALGQWQVAGKVYGFLIQDDPPLLLQSTIPLPWSDEPLNAGKSLRESSLAWIEDAAPELQLLGASWLLSGDQRPRAVETLERLSRSESQLIAAFAKAQLWRNAPPGEIASNNFAQWVAQRDAMPIMIQAGPTMLLAHRLHQAGEWELAVAEWLRIASLFPDRYHLKRDAIDRAIAACKAAGAIADADRIAARYLPSSGSNP